MQPRQVQGRRAQVAHEGPTATRASSARNWSRASTTTAATARAATTARAGPRALSAARAGGLLPRLLRRCVGRLVPGLRRGLVQGEGPRGGHHGQCVLRRGQVRRPGEPRPGQRRLPLQGLPVGQVLARDGLGHVRQLRAVRGGRVPFRVRQRQRRLLPACPVGEFRPRGHGKVRRGKYGDDALGRDDPTRSTAPRDSTRSSRVPRIATRARRAPGQYRSGCRLSSRGTCPSCNAGWHNPIPGLWNTECRKCNLGKFSQAPGAAKCDDCAVGQYQLVEGRRRATPATRAAPAGTVSRAACTRRARARTAPAGQCGACVTGQYSAPGWAACKDCGTGKYQDERQEASCKTCQTCPADSSATAARCPRRARARTAPCVQGRARRLEQRAASAPRASSRARQERVQVAPRRPLPGRDGKGVRRARCPRAGLLREVAGTCLTCPGGKRRLRRRGTESANCASASGDGATVCPNCATGKYQSRAAERRRVRRLRRGQFRVSCGLHTRGKCQACAAFKAPATLTFTAGTTRLRAALPRRLRQRQRLRGGRGCKHDLTSAELKTGCAAGSGDNTGGGNRDFCDAGEGLEVIDLHGLPIGLPADDGLEPVQGVRYQTSEGRRRATTAKCPAAMFRPSCGGSTTARARRRGRRGPRDARIARRPLLGRQGHDVHGLRLRHLPGHHGPGSPRDRQPCIAGSTASAAPTTTRAPAPTATAARTRRPSCCTTPPARLYAR